MNACPRRRALLVAVVFSIAALAVAGAAHGQSRTIGVLSWADAPAKGAGILQPLVVELGELGYVAGRTAAIEHRWAAGNTDRAAELAAELVALNVDVLVAHGLPAVLAARKATSTVPTVALAVEPVASEGNVVAVPTTSADLAAERVAVLRGLLPRLTRIAVLAPAGDPTARSFVSETEAAAKRHKLQPLPVLVSRPTELDGAFARLGRERIAAVVVHPAFDAQRARIAAAARQHRVAAISDSRAFAEAGNVASYGASARDVQGRAAVYVDRILKGAKPAEVPAQPPRQHALVLNLAAAKTLRIAIPPALVMRAEHTIAP